MAAAFVKVDVLNECQRDGFQGVGEINSSEWSEERREGERTIFIKEFHSERQLRQGTVAAEG